MVKALIVSAAEGIYAPLAHDLFASIRSLTFDVNFDLGLLDVGLSDQQRQHFSGQGIRVVKAISDIEYPMRTYWEKEKPGIRTLTSHPFLRRYFPGYDVYMWIDADIWVQTPEAINTMIAAALNSQAICLCCEFDRCYSTYFQSPEIWGKFGSWYQANFDAATVAAMTLKPMLNVGVFTLSHDSPLWEAWGQIYASVLQKTSTLNDKTFMAHQLGLNILLQLQGLPYMVMPTSYNWLTFYALPKFDRETGYYVEPLPPHRPIAQLHLTRPNKLGVETIECLQGGHVERPLIFSARA